MTETNLYLIRHGQAVGNVQPRVIDKGPEAGLTQLGRRQAERLRERLKASGEIAADVLISSTYTRAFETAQIVAPVWNLPIVSGDDVQEFRMGVDNMTNAEFDKQFGPPEVEQNPFRPVSPQGESLASFRLRVASTVDRIVRQYHGKNIVIFTHGGFIDNTFTYFFGLSSQLPVRVRLYTHNTSITHWRHNGDDFYNGWILGKYNDDFHIQGLQSEAELDSQSLVEPLEQASDAHKAL